MYKNFTSKVCIGMNGFRTLVSDHLVASEIFLLLPREKAIKN
jgi:hypothetical protein